MLVVHIQPDEGVSLEFAAKVPGQGMTLRTVHMDFLYGGAFRTEIPEAYERLILDCLLGDATLFTRADEVEEQWSLVDAIVAFWKRDKPAFPNYAAGTWGPAAADELLAPGRPGVATALSTIVARSTASSRGGGSSPATRRADPADERDDAHRLGADAVGRGRRGRARRARRAPSRRGRSCSCPTPTPTDGLDAQRRGRRATRRPGPAGLRRRRSASGSTATRAEVPASVVQPLLLPDLPVFLRWRGLPPFGERPFEELVDVVDRLIVDSDRVAGPAGAVRAAGRDLRPRGRLRHRLGPHEPLAAAARLAVAGDRGREARSR